jgi:hypothetical protein
MQLRKKGGIGIRKSQTIPMELQAEAAEILFGAVIKFLKKNNLDSKSILSPAKRAQGRFRYG